jgi:hypothetical protein
MPQYQRTGRRLKRNHCGYLPRYIVSFDTETFPTPDEQRQKRFSHKWRLATAVYARIVDTKPVGLRVERFGTQAAWWKFLENLTGPRHTTWVICHNALFDLVIAGMPEKFFRSELVVDCPRSKRSILDGTDDNEPSGGLLVLEGPPVIIGARFPTTNGRVVFVDSLNWFPQTLSSLGESAGIPKFPMPAFDEPDWKWFPYCERDSQIVFTTFLELIRWVKDNDMGQFRYTGPSQAMSAFRHRFMRHEILIHDNDDVKRLERKAYFGGRTEVFRIGELDQTVYQLDVNALFPSIMKDGVFPSKLERYELRPDYLELLPSIDWSASVAEVELETTEPLFPLRTEKIIIYPIGRFRTSLCGAELQHAVRRGFVKSARSWAEYKLEPLFVEWVDTLWAMRQQYKASGNKLYEQFAKKLMNSLYGKFGQLAYEWVDCPGVVAIEPWATWTEKNMLTFDRQVFRSWGWNVQRKQERRTITVRQVMENGRIVTELDEQATELSGTFPAISAFVTSAARMRMNGLRKTAGIRNVYYQGVDGLIVTGKGYVELQVAGELHETELGRLRLECTANDGEILGCSDYRLGDKVILSGRARPIQDKETGEIMQRKFSAKGQLFNGVAVDTVVETTQPWFRVAGYTKGLIQSDGWIAPFPLEVNSGLSGDPCNAAATTVSPIAETTAGKSDN